MKSRITKILQHCILWTLGVLQGPRYARIVVLSFPEFPYGRGYLLPKVLRSLGIRLAPLSLPGLRDEYVPLRTRFLRRLSRDSENRIIVVGFEDSTISQVNARKYLLNLEYQPEHLFLLNGTCNDISKRHVGAVFAEVFGYPLETDPLTHSGPMVEKSNLNGAHDGRILNGPIPESEISFGSVYQHVIDNSTDERTVVDLRCAIVGQEIALLYAKERPLANRFSNINTRVKLVPLSRLSVEEQDLIREFASKMGLDLGELDLLRDRDSGRLYVVDVNKTVAGPPNHITFFEGIHAIRTVASSFERQFLEDEKRYHIRSRSDIN